ncbi:MAG: glycosyltransferase family 9 protein [Ignavibacteriales bacterium]|nr:glycosyltransferase family 9 protein [Ignavibacteriales bacterium]
MTQKILIIQTAFLGDAILTLPLVQKVYELNGNTSIDILTIEQNRFIFESSPYVSNVIILDKKKKHRNIFKTLRFAKKLRKNKYTKIISPHRSFRTSIIVWALKVKESIGFYTSAFNFVYKTLIKYRIDYHEVQRNLSLLNNASLVQNWKILPKIIVSKEVIDKVKQFIKYLSEKKYIAIAPSSVWYTKTYPKEYYIRIINDLIEKGFFIFLIGGTDDKNYCEGIKNLFPDNIISTAGSFNVIETIELLKYCQLLICNDSAPTHMGMCADIPVLTIYCSTVPSFGFYPYNGKSKYLSYDELICKPCGIHGYKKCPIKTYDCAYLLTPERILHSVYQMLSL